MIDGGPELWARAHAAWEYGRALVDHLEPALADGKSRQEAEKAAALALLQREGRA